MTTIAHQEGLRFAANLTMLFNEVPFLQRFEKAAASGFKFVEFLFPYDFDVQVIEQALKRNKLQLVLHNLPAGKWDQGERGIACLPDRVDEFREGVETAIRYAQGLSVAQVNCLVGKRSPSYSADAMEHTLISNLRFAAKKLKQANIKLLIEPINTFDIPGFYLNRSDQAIALMNKVAEDNLYLQYDIYHMQRMEGEIASTLEKLLPRIAHVQLADNPGRNEPGTGEISYGFLFQRLQQLGYSGYIGCEYKPASASATATQDGLGWLKLAA